MRDLSRIAEIPGVLSALLSDSSGALLESARTADGEGAGAIFAYSSQSLVSAGEQLGLGDFRRATVGGPGKTCIIGMWEGAVLGIFVDPSKPLAEIERKLDIVLQR